MYGILMATVINRFMLTPLQLTDNEGLCLTLQTIISTLIVLVTGEFLPKTLFNLNSNKMLRIFAVPAYIIYVILYPVSKFTRRTLARRTENDGPEGQQAGLRTCLYED